MGKKIPQGYTGLNVIGAIALLFNLALTTSCSFKPFEFSSNLQEPIEKSANDQRQYQRIRLANSLDVLLISDPTTDKAAAALDLYVGSYQNPKQRQGLAHFLEHMLFLGTKQYPQADAYQTFISEHGGSHNASTGLEHTNYFFDINAEYLTDALDRFAPFFTDPLFDAGYVDRERKAVESEYQLKYKNDARRQWDVLREIANPSHPLSKFNVGNLQTLADNQQSDVRDELIDFYDKYYSANLMKLVVLGKEPLEQLNNIVRDRFSAIENKRVQIEPYRSNYIDPIKLPMQINVRPLKDTTGLGLLFELPKLDPYWKTKPADYLASMIGYEGQGSLLYALKEKGWADSLSAGLVLEDRGASLFSIDIGLTPEGYHKREQILIELFGWIKLIADRGIESWRQSENASIRDIAFKFAEKQNPARYATDLARRMHKHSGAELLRAPYVVNDFDSEIIKQIAAQLKPSNMLIFVSAPNIEVDSTSQFYQTPYLSVPLDNKSIDRLALSKPSLDVSLADKNPFIPESLELIVTPPSSTPRLYKEESGLRVWYLPNTEFGVPKAEIIISLASELTSTVEGLSAAKLYVAYLLDQLNDQLYPAYMAGLSYSVSASEKGLLVVVGGYFDKQEILLQKILLALKNPQWHADRFALIKQQVIREKNNSKRDYPFRQVISYLYSIVEGRWTSVDQAKAMQAIDMAALRDFSSRLMSSFDAKVLVSGNYQEASVNRIIKQLGSIQFKASDIKAKIARLPKKDISRYIEVDHNDAVLIQYIQGDNDSLRERASMSLIAQVVSPSFYNQLRTQKQLGYVVSAFPLHINRVPGIGMLVQSPVASEQALAEEFGDFAKSFASQMKQLSNKELEQHKSALLVNLEKSPDNLSELNTWLFKSLSLGYEGFDFRSQLAAEIRSITVSDIQHAYDRLIVKQPRQLLVQTQDNNKKNKLLNDNGRIDHQYLFPY